MALVTPFDAELKIDYPALKRVIDFVSDNGVDYLVVNGTTGESATTNKQEKHAILDFTKKNNPRNLPIMYGTGGYDTQDIIDHVKEMDWSGVSSLLSVSPYYNRPSQKGIIAHFEAIADACPVPVIMYNVPKRTGSNMESDTTVALAGHPNIAGIKEASGDMAQAVEIISQTPDDFAFISGDDMCTLPLICTGAVGVISVLANAFPKTMSDMVRLALAGDLSASKKLLFSLSAVNPLMYCESSPVGIKEALTMMGLCENHVRLPLVKGSESLRAQIKAQLEKVRN